MKTAHRILVRTQPRASKPGVEKISDTEYKVRVHAPPEGGKANQEVIALLSRHFRVPKRSVHILSGHASRKKTLQIETE